MSKIRFSDGMPIRKAVATSKPDEYKSRTCGECFRFPENGGRKCRLPHKLKASDDPQGDNPSDAACHWFWDKAEQDELDRLHEEDTERRRKELWAIYADKPPVKLPLVFDGYGTAPECPICGEMPYSTEQCHWCGQHFLQTEETKEYEEPAKERRTCPLCGVEGAMVGSRSKYNGHFHGVCENCGCKIME